MEMDTEWAASCAFTGHRPATLPWGNDESDPRCVALKERLSDAVVRAYTLGCRHFICGMALGADLYFCEAVLALRARYPDIRLEAAVPFPGQCQNWARADQERYRDLLARCDIETVIQQSYSLGCMQRRNRYMVDHAGRLIAVFNGDPKGSGTLATIQYALRRGIELDLLHIPSDEG